MVQAKCKIESRIAITGSLRIEKNRALAAHENILRADIAMHQRNARLPKIARHGLDARGTIRVRLGGVKQVRLDAQRHEHFIVRKLRGNLRPVCAGTMNISDGAPDSTCKIGIDMAFEQLGLPAGIIGGSEIVHREKMRRLILSQNMRNAAGLDIARETKPVHLAMYTFNRRQPFGGHTQARQGLLHADEARSKVHPENIAGDPAGEGHDGRHLVCADKIHAAQSGKDFGNRAHGDVAIALVTAGVNSRHFEI